MVNRDNINNDFLLQQLQIPQSIGKEGTQRSMHLHSGS